MQDRTITALQRLARGGRPLPKLHGDDRRIWDRFPSDHETTVRLGLDGDDAMTARIQEVSRGGIRLLLDQAVEPGSMIRIDLPRGGGDASAVAVARVVHVKQGRDGRFSVGCHCSTELSDADLAVFGARRDRLPRSEQRAHPRMTVAGRATYARADDAGSAKPADIHNISLTGVALVVTDELAAGSLLNVVLMDSVGRKVMAIVACVVYLTPLETGKWLAGCNFVRELYDEDLASLIAPVG